MIADPDILVYVEGLCAGFRVERHRALSLREAVVRRGRSWWRREPEWSQALSDVSLTLRKGELLAVVGPNGAGKTTLLRVLAGIVPPGRGVVRVRGMVAPLIELGGGFDPDLTGRENAILFSCLLGRDYATALKAVGGIARFAELEHCMDLPLRGYSSGMVARLAFAAATAIDADVLLVDEVLAVGDESFRRRCLARIETHRNDGGGVVLVTHDLGLIEKYADSAVLLDRGRIVAAGNGVEVIAGYRASISS